MIGMGSVGHIVQCLWLSVYFRDRKCLPQNTVPADCLLSREWRALKWCMLARPKPNVPNTQREKTWPKYNFLCAQCVQACIQIWFTLPHRPWQTSMRNRCPLCSSLLSFYQSLPFSLPTAVMSDFLSLSYSHSFWGPLYLLDCLSVFFLFLLQSLTFFVFSPTLYSLFWSLNFV